MVKKFNDKGKGKGKIGIASSRETSKHSDKFRCFDTIPARDRQMDAQPLYIRT